MSDSDPSSVLSITSPPELICNSRRISETGLVGFSSSSPSPVLSRYESMKSNNATRDRVVRANSLQVFKKFDTSSSSMGSNKGECGRGLLQDDDDVRKDKRSIASGDPIVIVILNLTILSANVVPVALVSQARFVFNGSSGTFLRYDK